MLTDKQIEREEAFCEDWYMTRKMGKTPTYADAIAWADKTIIDKAINWLKENASNYIVDIGGRWECKTIVGGMCWLDLRKYLEE